MQYLRADTEVKVVVGPVVAVGDGFTPVTTLSVSTADEAEMMKHDAAAVTSISGNTFAAITNFDGYYNLTLTAAQLDTEGMLTIGINDDSLCLPVRHDFMVVSANVFDSLYAADTTDYLRVDAFQVAGTTQDATDLADFAAAGYDPATNKVQGVVLVDTVTTLTGHTPQTGDNYARLGAPAGASVSADVAAVKVDTAAILVDTGTTLDGKIDVIDGIVDAILIDTAEIGAAGAGLTNIGTIATVTNLTNLPTIPTDWLTAAGIAADAGTEIGTAVWATATRVLTAGTNLNDFNPATDTVALVTSVGSVTGAVGSVSGNVDGSVASVTGAVGSVTAQVSADMTALSGSATAADNLEASALSILPFAATGVPTTTTIPASALGVTVNDLLIGRVVIVTSGNAQYEAARITNYDQASLTMTVTIMTTPMVAGDTGVIV